MKNNFLNSKGILALVETVERSRKYKKKPGLIMRHLVEEIGEVSRELWKFEASRNGLRSGLARRVAYELVDVVSLAVYLADSVGADVSEEFPDRFRQIAAQYLNGKGRKRIEDILQKGR